MENCSRPNSETVNHIHLKQVAPRGMTQRLKDQRSRPQCHVTYSVKITITHYWWPVQAQLGGNMRTTPQPVGHKMVAMAMQVA